MSKIHEDTCVGCTSMGLHCRREACKNFKGADFYYCDECERAYDPEELYDVDGDMLCADCILGKYQTIAQIEEGD